MRRLGHGRTLVAVSLYEALSLVVSTVGTLGTVYIGLRQLRQGVPAAGGQAVAYGPAQPSPPVARPPWPTPVAHAPWPRPSPVAHAPWPRPSPVAHAPWPRPSPVTAASLVLFVAASAHPFTVAVYYAIRFATEPSGTAAELRSEGIIDVLVFGGIAFLTALLGIFVARGSRVARWCVWVLGGLSSVLLCLLAGAAALATLAPEAERLTGFELLFLGYFGFVLVAYMVGAVLLVNARSRAFFRRVERRSTGLLVINQPLDQRDGPA